MSFLLPESIVDLLQLYTQELSGLRFGDLDHATLAAAAELVKQKAEAVARAEAALSEARAALAEARTALDDRAQRAVAYAQVFAADSPALQQRVDAIAQELAPARVPPTEPARKRGRPAKARESFAPTLPLSKEDADSGASVAVS